MMPRPLVISTDVTVEPDAVNAVPRSVWAAVPASNSPRNGAIAAAERWQTRCLFHAASPIDQADDGLHVVEDDAAGAGGAQHREQVALAVQDDRGRHEHLDRSASSRDRQT